MKRHRQLPSACASVRVRAGRWGSISQPSLGRLGATSALAGCTAARGPVLQARAAEISPSARLPGHVPGLEGWHWVHCS